MHKIYTKKNLIFYKMQWMVVACVFFLYEMASWKHRRITSKFQTSCVNVVSNGCKRWHDISLSNKKAQRNHANTERNSVFGFGVHKWTIQSFDKCGRRRTKRSLQNWSKPFKRKKKNNPHSFTHQHTNKHIQTVSWKKESHSTAVDSHFVDDFDKIYRFW